MLKYVKLKNPDLIDYFNRNITQKPLKSVCFDTKISQISNSSVCTYNIEWILNFDQT